MRRAGVVVATLLIAVSVGGTGHAAGSVNHGGVIFSQGPFGAAPIELLFGTTALSAGSVLNEGGWWYRISGDASESSFPLPDSEDYVDRTAKFFWANVNGDGFSAAETQRVTDTGGPSGSLRSVLTITNPDPVALTIHVFHAIDPSLPANMADDAAELLPGRVISITDQTGQRMTYAAKNADKFEVLAVGASDTSGILNDGDVDNYADSGLPFGPGNITAGFQFEAELIPAGGSRSFTTVLDANRRTSYLSVASAVVEEGDSGTTVAKFKITRSGFLQQKSSVTANTTDASATVGDGDYVELSPTVINFAKGQRTRTVKVLVNGDAAGEGQEEFRVDLGTPVNAAIVDTSADGIILNDD